MALFKKRRKSDQRALQWAWDPQAANVSGEQSWALLTNAIYFRAVAPRLDTLGGGLEALDWAQGLATWWDVRDEREFDSLVEWMQAEGHRKPWNAKGADDGDEKFAWDYCRMITVTGGAALANVISSDKAWSLVMHASDSIYDRFDSWSDVADNYLSGRILWLTDSGQWEPTPDPSQAHFEQVADDLLDDETSPWNRVAWERSAGIIVDGEPLA